MDFQFTNPVEGLKRYNHDMLFHGMMWYAQLTADYDVLSLFAEQGSRMVTEMDRCFSLIESHDLRVNDVIIVNGKITVKSEPEYGTEAQFCDICHDHSYLTVLKGLGLPLRGHPDNGCPLGIVATVLDE